MSRRNSEDDIRKKSNHRMAPEPVQMTRSGVGLINDLLESPTEEQPEQRGRRPSYHGTLRRDESGERIRSVSGDRLSQDRMSNGSRDRMSSRDRLSSRDRMSTRDRLPSQDRMSTRDRLPSQDRMINGDSHHTNSFHDSQYHYGSQADASRSNERLTTAPMTAQEQAYYREREFLADPFDRRSRRSTVDLEEARKDEELRKRAKKAWGRPAWHPITVVQGTIDYLASSKLLLAVLAICFVLGLAIAGLLTYFLWPRAVSIKFVDLEHDKTPNPYRVIPREGGVHLRLQSWILVDVRNPNYFPALIKKSQVVANWMTVDGRREMFGGSITDAEVALKKRETYRLRLPVTIEYMGAPESDPIYSDFLERCYVGDEIDGRRIGLEWDVQVTTEAKGLERTGVILVERTMACPIGKDMIEAALGQLSIDPAALKRRRLPRK